MADPITEFTQAVRLKLIGDASFSSIFDNRYYIYSVPDDWQYPYATSFSLNGTSWMTLGNVNSGESFIFPVYAHGESPADLRTGTSAINDLLHLGDVEMDNYQLIYARRVLWNKPQEVEKDEGVYIQLIQFSFMIEKI